MRSYINGMSPYPNKDEPKEEMKNLNLGSDKMISEQKPNKEEEPKKVGIYPDLTEIILKKDVKDQNTIN